jgi:hypothetical protein
VFPCVIVFYKRPRNHIQTSGPEYEESEINQITKLTRRARMSRGPRACCSAGGLSVLARAYFRPCGVPSAIYAVPAIYLARSRDRTGRAFAAAILSSVPVDFFTIVPVLCLSNQRRESRASSSFGEPSRFFRLNFKRRARARARFNIHSVRNSETNNSINADRLMPDKTNRAVNYLRFVSRCSVWQMAPLRDALDHAEPRNIVARRASRG